VSRLTGWLLICFLLIRVAGCMSLLCLGRRRSKARTNDNFFDNNPTKNDVSIIVGRYSPFMFSFMFPGTVARLPSSFDDSQWGGGESSSNFWKISYYVFFLHIIQRILKILRFDDVEIDTLQQQIRNSKADDDDDKNY